MRSITTPYNFMAGKQHFSFLFFCFAACYGLGLSLLPVDAFVDRDNYLVYASSSAEIISRYVGEGALSVLFNEPMWLCTNIFLEVFFSPENTLRFIIFISSFITAFLALKHDSRYFIFVMVILFLPQVIKNNIIHLRQGLAIAIFLCGWFSSRSYFRYSCLLLACLIHSSFLMILFLFVLNEFFIKFRYGSDLRALIVMCASLLIGILGVWVAGALGARQADQYADEVVAVSGLGFIFWATVAGIFVCQGKVFLHANSLQVSLIIFYLSTYFFLPVTARIFESGLLLVLLSALQLTSYRKYTFLVVFSLYFLLQWSSRLFLPAFGWGVENYI